MYGIGREFAEFICAVLSGGLVALSYEVIHLFRQFIRHSLLVTGMEDFLFSTVAGIYLFIQMFHTSYGNIRWYFILGVVLGFVFVKCVILRGRKMINKVLEKREKRL